jgi:hypothetical protein
MSEPWEDYQAKESAPWEDFTPKTELPDKKEEGLFTRIGGDIKKSWEERTAPEMARYNMEYPILSSGGFLAEVGNKVIGQGLRSAYQTLVPKKAQEVISSTAKDIVSSPYVAEPVKAIGEIYGAIKKEYPSVMAGVEDVANIGGFLTQFTGGKVVAKEGLNIGKDIKTLIHPATDEGLQKGLGKTITKGSRNAGVTPTRVTAYKDIERFENSLVKSGRDIILEKKNFQFVDADKNLVKGELPQTVAEWSQVIPQGKHEVIRKTEAMLKDVGDSGGIVPTQNAIDVINAIEKSPILEAMKVHPQYDSVLKTMEDMKRRYAIKKILTPSEANADIQTLNSLISSKADTLSDFVNLGLVKAQREALNNAMDSLGGRFQELKKTWGAYNEVEDRIAKRATAIAGQEGKITYWDRATFAEGVAGLMTANPGIIAASILTKGGLKITEKIFHPDRAVRKMFEKTEKLMAKEGQGYQSYTARKIQGLRNTKHKR